MNSSAHFEVEAKVRANTGIVTITETHFREKNSLGAPIVKAQMGIG